MLYFRYLVNSASNVEIVEHKKIEKHEPREIELRMEDIPEQRKRQLEQKMEVFFAKDRFSPYRNRLKKIRKNFERARKKKKPSKTEVKKIRTKINNCESILKEIEKMNLPDN